MSLQQIKKMYSDLSHEDFHYVLWEWTAYPMGEAKTVVKQFQSKMRADKNNRTLCECCGCDISTLKHKAFCPDR